MKGGTLKSIYFLSAKQKSLLHFSRRANKQPLLIKLISRIRFFSVDKGFLLKEFGFLPWSKTAAGFIQIGTMVRRESVLAGVTDVPGLPLSPGL